ncbi:MAG: hypothetical protein HC900_12095 [Methylacidiphilales bacterium]|nr:hypothetical protein [Candidatus Methylacidiphilales bacterium]
MSDRAIATFWVPLLAMAGFLLLGVPFADLSPDVEIWAIPTAIGLGPALLMIAGLFVYKIKSNS